MKVMTAERKAQVKGCQCTPAQEKSMVRMYRRHGDPVTVRPFSDHVGMVYRFGYIGIETDGYTHM